MQAILNQSTNDHIVKARTQVCCYLYQVIKLSGYDRGTIEHER